MTPLGAGYEHSTDCFAVPGDDTLVDMIHPLTGRSVCYGKTLDDVRHEYPNAEVMTYDAWSLAKAERQNVPVLWEDTTEQHYNYMFEVLPPAVYGSRGFLVGEPWDHEARTGSPRFQAFRIIGRHYVVSSRPMTIAEFRALR
jgi:hypothetical protein